MATKTKGKIKLKTHSASKKRFSITGTGKIKRSKAGKRHLMTCKSRKTKRQLKDESLVSSANAPAIRVLIPYK